MILVILSKDQCRLLGNSTALIFRCFVWIIGQLLILSIFESLKLTDKDKVLKTKRYASRALFWAFLGLNKGWLGKGQKAKNELFKQKCQFQLGKPVLTSFPNGHLENESNSWTKKFNQVKCAILSTQLDVRGLTYGQRPFTFIGTRKSELGKTFDGETRGKGIPRFCLF